MQDDDEEILVTFTSANNDGPFLKHEDLKRARLSVEFFPGDSGYGFQKRHATISAIT
jgi:hypothetical protein